MEHTIKNRATSRIICAPLKSLRPQLLRLPRSYPAIVAAAAAHCKNIPLRPLIPSVSLSHQQLVNMATQQSNPDKTVASSDKTVDIDSKILSVLQNAVNDASPTAQTAEQSADAIDKLFREDQAAGGDAEKFLWSLWGFVIEVAKKIPATDKKQAKLVDIIGKLKAKKGDSVEIWGQKAAMWDDLALFGPVMREAWNMSIKFDGSEKDKANIQEWVSLNSFAARLLGASLQDWINFAVWELRAGLEEPLSTAAAKDMHLTTASEWLLHAGKVLHAEGAKAKKLEDHEARVLASGSLLKDQSGATPQRWEFWKQRLAVLGGETSDHDIKHVADRTLKHLNDQGV